MANKGVKIGRLNRLTPEQLYDRTFSRYVKFVENFGVPGVCWNWTGGLAGGKEEHGRYGTFKPSGGDKQMYAHRFSYEHFIGPLPIGMVVSHKCRNKLCQNPEHLESKTHVENIKESDGMASGLTKRVIESRMATHCRNGHLWSENSSYNTKGVRYCRLCSIASKSRYRSSH